MKRAWRFKYAMYDLIPAAPHVRKEVSYLMVSILLLKTLTPIIYYNMLGGDDMKSGSGYTLLSFYKNY